MIVEIKFSRYKSIYHELNLQFQENEGRQRSTTAACRRHQTAALFREAVVHPSSAALTRGAPPPSRTLERRIWPPRFDAQLQIYRANSPRGKPRLLLAPHLCHLRPSKPPERLRIGPAKLWSSGRG
jgi:hypothetical protein